MKWERKTVLVTGAGGFIGSHLVEKLFELKAKVKCFVKYNSRNNWGNLDKLPNYIIDNIEIIVGDINNPESIRKAIKGVDIVFHLASLIAVPYSYINPREVFETNVIGTYNVASAALEGEVEKFVHTSSSEVYGTGRYIPIDEKHILQPQSPYSASKIGADKVVESFYYSFDLPITIIRPFNTYGPRQSARAIIPTIILQVLSKKKEVFLGSMHTIRDFTYVSDVVEAFIKIAESEQSIGEVINVGTGKEIDIESLAEKIIKMIGGKGKKITFDATRVRPEKSEVERLCADVTKAKRLLKWQPLFSLEEGLKRTIDWYSQNISMYKTDIYNV